AGRSRLATNVELVQRLVRISGEFERPLATCTQVRTRLGLRQSQAVA
ncbi:MAG: 3-keto-5-aminohexanoate cleavage protein, partial [Gammaproteobacteria bacterium]|nr:3-keto-5-aminohexanoate cleavage protein [Gammaproteobacteria bacterium]